MWWMIFCFAFLALESFLQALVKTLYRRYKIPQPRKKFCFVNNEVVVLYNLESQEKFITWYIESAEEMKMTYCVILAEKEDSTKKLGEYLNRFKENK